MLLRLVALLGARLVLVGLLTLVAIAIVPIPLGWRATVVSSGSMAPAIQRGDVVLYQPVAITAVQPGAIVVTDRPGSAGSGRIHRVVGIEPDGTLRTQGDANREADSDTTDAASLRGRAGLRVPWVGHPTLWVRSGQVVPLAIATVVLTSLVLLARRPRTHEELPETTDATERGNADASAHTPTEARTDAHPDTLADTPTDPPTHALGEPPADPPGDVPGDRGTGAPSPTDATVPGLLPADSLATDDHGAERQPGRLVTVADRRVVALAARPAGTVRWLGSFDEAPAATAVAGDHLAVAIGNVLHGLDADGRRAWVRPLPQAPLLLVSDLHAGQRADRRLGHPDALEELGELDDQHVDELVVVWTAAFAPVRADDGVVRTVVPLALPALPGGFGARIGGRLAYTTTTGATDATSPRRRAVAVVDIAGRAAGQLVAGQGDELGGRIVGAGAVPTGAGELVDRLVVGPTPGTDGDLVAVDLPCDPGGGPGGGATRQVRWRATGGQPLGIVTVERTGDAGAAHQVIVVRRGHGIDGVDLHTGATRWTAAVVPLTEDLLDAGEGHVALLTGIAMGGDAPMIDLAVVDVATGTVSTRSASLPRVDPPAVIL